MTTTQSSRPTFRTHTADGTRTPFWTEPEARTVAATFATITGGVVGIETLTEYGEWALTDLVAADISIAI